MPDSVTAILAFKQPMSRVIWCAAVALCATACTERGVSSSNSVAPSSDDFEGEIDMTASGEGAQGGATPIVLLTKGHKTRVSAPGLSPAGGFRAFGANAYAVVDAAEKRLYLVMDSRQQVVIVDLDKGLGQLASISRTPEPSGAAQGLTAPAKVTKTGRTVIVAGRECDDWNIVGDGVDGTVCVAKLKAPWLAFPTVQLPTASPWMRELLDGEHLPLRYVAYASGSRAEKSRIEVTKIERKSIEVSEFSYPSSYRTLDLNQMFLGLGATRDPDTELGRTSTAHAAPRGSAARP